MDITLDIFNTPEGRSLEGKIKVPFIATLDWLDKMIFSFWFRASSQNGLVGLGNHMTIQEDMNVSIIGTATVLE